MRLQLHVELLLPNTGLPPVWRRILVPAHWVFEELSDVIQVCMGWEFEHPWVFSDAAENATEHIAEDDEDYGFEGKSMLAYDVQLSEKFKNKGDQYFWTYNFDDEWTHRITLEEVMADEEDKAVLIDGAGDCPPETIGGAGMYEQLVKTAADPAHPDEYNFREILGLKEGESMDLTLFDIEEARQRLANLNHLYQTYDESELEEEEDL